MYGGTDIAYGEETSMYGGSLKECLMCVISIFPETKTSTADGECYI